MSMLSAQCDELRKLADGQATYRDAREAMLEAADTILSLRDRAQALQAENAKLREEFRKMDEWHSKELSAAMAENAKLRELVKEMSICMDNSKPHCKQCKFRELGCQWFKFADRIRELGIEVD